MTMGAESLACCLERTTRALSSIRTDEKHERKFMEIIKIARCKYLGEWQLKLPEEILDISAVLLRRER